MERILTYTITAQEAPMRIGAYLQAQGFSRHIRTHIKQHPGSLLLNGETALFYQPLAAGDRLTVRLVDEESSEKIPPVPLPITIVYEDEDLLIINKPADMPIHPSQGNYENTLANGIAWYYASQNIPFVYRCINRLDRDTTGLLILAKNMLSAALLSTQMKERKIHRTYLAIAEGRVPDSGTINAPIGRVDTSVIERQVDFENGDPAVTHFTRIACRSLEKMELSLVKLQLETGRTHQIRVHLTHLGYPLCGDTLYNPQTQLMTRQALHSYSLEFQHPVTKQNMFFTAPLPEDMAALFPL